MKTIHLYVPQKNHECLFMKKLKAILGKLISVMVGRSMRITLSLFLISYTNKTIVFLNKEVQISDKFKGAFKAN